LITAFTAREYWTIQAILETAAGEKFPAEVVRIDGAALDVGDEETAERHRAAIETLHPSVTKVGTRTLTITGTSGVMSRTVKVTLSVN